MALFDEALNDTLSVLDTFADELFKSNGTIFDRLTDETLVFSDLMSSEMDLGRVSSDTLSLAADSIALANSYQYTPQDTVGLSDQVLIETTFNSDPIIIDDHVYVTRTVGASAFDTVSATDSAVTGFVRWTSPQDTLVIAEQLTIAMDYRFTLPTDTVTTSDVPHTWKLPSDAIISADLTGDGDLRAVLNKRKPPSELVVNPPPRVVKLPKPPAVRTEHPVVNPNPPNREDR